MTKYFLFDCETGGLPESNPSLLTVYGIILNSKLEQLDKINLAIRPGKRELYKIQPEALRINRINLIEHTEDAISEKFAKEKLIRFLVHYYHSENEKLILVGQNINFDIFFLKRLLGKEFWNEHLSYRTIDVASVSQFLKLAGKLPEDLSCSLESLANHFNLSYVGAHNAEFDAELTLNVLKQLLALNKFVEMEGSL